MNLRTLRTTTFLEVWSQCLSTGSAEAGGASSDGLGDVFAGAAEELSVVASEDVGGISGA